MESVITLIRKEYTDESTIGDLSFDGEFVSFSLEDTVRDHGPKIYGKTAIPKGRYEIVISYSNKFQKMLPLLVDVPNFKGVRIHSGNTPADSDGCILTGYTKGVNFVGDSRAAFKDLMARITGAIKLRKVFIEIA